MHPCDNAEALLRTLQPARRNHYFYGKRMDVQHFEMEQDYGKLRQWLANRLTFGKGVVCGLGISVEQGKLCVDPGFAIDGLGREIVVPVRACIDPVTQEGGCCPPCCKETGATPPPQPPPTPAPSRDGAAPDEVAAPSPAPAAGDAQAPTRGVFTLWLCYRECLTDFQPVLVSDCGTRDPCAPGTTIETFCLKVTPGTPPLQGDPKWCPELWKRAKAQPQPEGTPATPGNETPVSILGRAEPSSLPSPSRGASSPNAPTATGVRNARESGRVLLCTLLDETCDAPEGDPCVPLAVFALDGDKPIRFETCLVRPRVYSNEVLLDLILCLAQKIDECCNDKKPPAETMRVRSVEFLGGPEHKVLATVKSPLDPTALSVAWRVDAIRVTFTQPLDQAANAPTTPAMGDPKWQRHDVIVTTQADPASAQTFVPGLLRFDDGPDTLRWELDPKSQLKEMRMGHYTLALYGDADAALGRKPVVSTNAGALDGEPIAPAGNVISGDGHPGGKFTLNFEIYG
jgi:hypothetical protein